MKKNNFTNIYRFEHSHISLSNWARATHFLNSPFNVGAYQFMRSSNDPKFDSWKLMDRPRNGLADPRRDRESRLISIFSASKNPGMFEDPGLKHVIKTGGDAMFFLCGFRQLADIPRWFQNELLVQQLFDFGFALRRYRCKTVHHGWSQSVVDIRFPAFRMEEIGREHVVDKKT